MKKILLIISLILMMVIGCNAQDGTYTTNEYFYLPLLGAYGSDEFDEYNAYMEIADNQIEANRVASGDENICDVSGAKWTGNTETFITITYQDADNTVDAVVPVKDEDNMASDSDTHLATQQSIKKYVDDVAGSLTEEEVEDFVGGMLGGTETFISVDYQDGTNDIDFVVPVKDEDNMGSDSAVYLATQQSIKKYVDDVATGYTVLTEFVDQTAFRVFYSDTAGDVTELALGVDGTYLGSNGATSNPTFSTPAGAGDMLMVVYDTDEDGDIEVSAGGTEKSSWTQYAIPYLTTSTAFGEIAIGVDNYALTVNGTTGYDFTHLQPYDEGLLSIAALTTSANDMIYTTGLDTYAIMDTFAEIQAIVADKTLVNEEDVCTIDANWVNTTHPWADNEVDDDITIDLATLATTLTITDNESTNEDNAVLFTAGGDVDGGNLGIESDGDLYYNPSTGALTAKMHRVYAVSETTALNAGWWQIKTTAVTGDLTGLRTVMESNAASGGDAASGLNVRGLYGQAVVSASKHAGLLQGVLGVADMSAGSATVYNVHVGSSHYSSGASNTIGGDLYGYLIRTQTRSTNSRTVAGHDVGLGIENEAIEGTGMTMDSAIRMFGTNTGVDDFTYGIDMNDADITTAEIRMQHGETLKNTTDGTIESSGYLKATNVFFGSFANADAPDADDDTTGGYVVGSTWIDTTNDKAYICLDNTDGAAVWAGTETLSFLNLSDTPAAYETGKYAKSTAAGVVWDSPAITDKLKWVFPQDYATGTGTSGDPWAGDCVDDAIAAASAGDTIYLRAGYYQLDGQCAIAKPLNIIGEGMGITFVVTDDAHGFISTPDGDYLTIKNLTVDGDAQTDNTAWIACIRIDRSDNILIENVETKNAGYYGIHMLSANYGILQNIYSHDNYRHGVKAATETAGRDKWNSYQNIYAWDNGSGGLDDGGNQNYNTDEQHYNTYDNIHCWDNGTHGIYIGAQKNGILSNSSVRGNTNYGIFIDMLSDFNIHDCIIDGSGLDGLEVRDSNNLNFSNIIVKNASTGDGASCGISVDGSTDINFVNCQSYDERKVTGVDIAFVEANGGEDTITQVSAGFLRAGFIATKDITVTGAAEAGNNSTFTIASVVAGTINVPTASLTTEAAGEAIIITHEKLQAYGMITVGSADNIVLVNCDFSGNLTGNISNGASATITSYSVESETLRIGDGLWTNYVKITDAGVVTLEGTANIESVTATEFGYVDGVTEDIQTALTAAARNADTETISGAWTFTDKVGINRAHDTASSSAYLVMRRATDGDPTDDVADGDYLGKLLFYGWFDDAYDQGAEIRAVIDGTPSTDTDMPSKLEFLTSADGSSSPTLAMTISPAQVVTFANDLADSEISDTLTSSTCTGQAATVATITTLAPDTATTQATQASITTCTNLTTVGAIANGTWESTDVALAYGGTGVSTGAMVNFTSMLNAALYVGRDTDNTINFATDNTIKFQTNGVANVEILPTGELDFNAFSAVFTEQVLTPGTAVAWDLGNSNKATLTPAQNFTITITAPSGALNAQLIVTQDGTGSRVMDEITTQADATIATTDVHADTEIIDITIDIPTGARIRFDNDVGTDVPEPLVENTIYYAIREDATHIKVATTKALAIAGTNVDITDQGTNVHTVEQLVKWAGGALGVLTTDAGGEDILALTYKTADKQWYAQLALDFQ